jgi:hypothetical protein
MLSRHSHELDLVSGIVKEVEHDEAEDVSVSPGDFQGQLIVAGAAEGEDAPVDISVLTIDEPDIVDEPNIVDEVDLAVESGGLGHKEEERPGLDVITADNLEYHQWNIAKWSRDEVERERGDVKEELKSLKQVETDLVVGVADLEVREEDKIAEDKSDVSYKGDDISSVDTRESRDEEDTMVSETEEEKGLKRIGNDLQLAMERRTKMIALGAGGLIAAGLFMYPKKKM